MENKAGKLLGEKIKSGRLRLNLTANEFLKKLDIHSTPGFLSMVESGKRFPSISTVIKMADLFGTNRYSLFLDLKYARLEEYSQRFQRRWEYWLKREKPV